MLINFNRICKEKLWINTSIDIINQQAEISNHDIFKLKSKLRGFEFKSFM